MGFVNRVVCIIGHAAKQWAGLTGSSVHMSGSVGKERCGSRQDRA